MIRWLPFIDELFLEMHPATRWRVLWRWFSIREIVVLIQIGMLAGGFTAFLWIVVLGLLDQWNLLTEATWFLVLPASAAVFAGLWVWLMLVYVASEVANKARELDARKECRACGYDLRGSRSATCPECGAHRSNSERIATPAESIDPPR